MRALFVSSLLALLTLVLIPGAGVAGAAECVPYSLTQTYRGWGPADHYGHPVTVVYSGIRCSTTSAGAAEVDITGTAAIYKGSVVDIRSFQASGTWTKGAASAWPPPWWSCSVDHAQIQWTIPGVYSFAVSASDGAWTLDVQTWGREGRTVHWAPPGCA